MTDIDTTTAPDVETFRARLREFLAAEAPAALAAGGDARARNRAFRGKLYDAGFFGITWPKAYGGLGLGAEYQQAFDAELRAYPDIQVGELVTVGICAPTLLDFGTEEQKKRHIGAMLRGDETWTQLLSEPGAGSDLAGMQTRAELDGDEWVVNGQKVWTSGAQWSHYAIMVARTNIDVPKHAGVSMFIVDMKLPGVTIRPLRQMTGAEEFNEVFLDDVRLPADALVGEKDDGWRALTRMLMHERMAIGAGTGGSRMGKDMFTTLTDLARQNGVLHRGAVQEALVDIYIRENILGWMGQRQKAAAAAGKPPGAEGSILKIANAQLARITSNVGMIVGGPVSQAWDAADPDGGELARASNHSPMTAIAGGTTEIQRNTIGERVLGLPKEPSADKGVAFKDVKANPVAR
ncbi:MAG: acyl-CoA dehydrogenase family protein [Acidimicrobiia bacterium]